MILEASESDYHELYQLEKEWCEEGVSPYLTLSTRQDFYKDLKQSSVFVKKINNKIIGYAIVKIRTAKEDNNMHKIKQGEEYADLDSLFVKKAYRNKRVGSELLEKSIREVKKSGYKKIILSADSKHMKDLINFYKKYGFRTVFTRMMMEL